MALWRAVVRLTFPIGAQHGTNTWHMRSTGIEPADTDVQDLLDAIQAFYDATASSRPTDYHATFDGFVTQVGVEDPAAVGGYDQWDSVGTNTSLYGPAPAMLCVTWRSSQASRRGRGRTFFGPLGNNTFANDGTLGTGLQTDYEDAAADLISSSSAVSNGAIGVYSQTDGLLRDYVAATVRDEVAVLRSRRG